MLRPRSPGDPPLAPTVHGRCIVAGVRFMNASTALRSRDTSPAPIPRAGDVVSAKYRLVRPLGEGGMGIVFEAVHLRLRQKVAIKFLRPDVLRLPDAVERFEREARASGGMRGPHVVHVLDVDTDVGGRPYMVMELLRGRDLDAELQARGPLPIAQAVDWVLQACAAVVEAHAAGIVHRDLKPSNLFLDEQDRTRVVKVLDFGISKSAHEEEAAVTSTAVTVGTPLYMSPEQVRSSRDVDGRTDIWSLGVILYELIAGAPPFLGTTTAAIAAIVADATPSLRDVRREVPDDLERAIMTALAKAPEDRFPTAEAFGAALMPFASPEGIDGPFSLRPSRRAFEIASCAMARAPSGPRASDASDLLKLPTARPPPVGRTLSRFVAAFGEPRTRALGEAVRTFAGTMAIGVGLATAVTLATAPPPQRSIPPERAPAPRGTAVVITSRVAKCHEGSAHPDCLNPSGSTGAGGRSIRRSSDP
jgi:serine/threonine protein kinase